MKPSSPFLLFFLPLAAAVTAAAAAGDIYALVYKGCANQSFPGYSLPATVSALSASLTSSSASSSFFKTTSSAAGGGADVFGLFQCRGDLSSSDCAACVNRALGLWPQLCGAAIASRVQLAGCLALYEISGFPQVSGTQLLFKTCSTSSADSDFEVRRDTAFAQLEAGLGSGGSGGSSGSGFFATSYQSVYAMAQCEGDLSVADCGLCVTQAVQQAEVECGGAPAGQVYLDKCYISYSYYPHGVPNGGGGGYGGGGSGSSGDSGQQTSKTVAIVLGGAVGLGFVVICLLFTKSLLKKNDEY